MNNINIIENGQQVSVSLIAYFSNNNKNYIFYTKNETVQDGLIKMYVSSQNTGVNEAISDDEWANLKKIMQGIIMGNSNVVFIGYSNPITINEPRAIALKDDNIKSINSAYNGAVSSDNGGGTNKDLLAQNFGGNTSTPEVPGAPQISSIPNVQNNFNMEATPVNLNTTPAPEPIVTPEIPIPEVVNPINSTPNPSSANPLDSIPSIEPINPTPKLENEPLTINNVKPVGADNNSIDSGFKVNNEPNIFDQPVVDTKPQGPILPDTNIFNITQEEVNNPLDAAPVSQSDSTIEPFAKPTVEPINNTTIPDLSPASPINLQSNVTVSNPSNNDSLVSKKIELNEKKIKLFEELANIYREENEMMRNESDGTLEHTASDLFNNNGTLNENKVLED